MLELCEVEIHLPSLLPCKSFYLCVDVFMWERYPRVSWRVCACVSACVWLQDFLYQLFSLSCFNLLTFIWHIDHNSWMRCTLSSSRSSWRPWHFPPKLCSCPWIYMLHNSFTRTNLISSRASKTTVITRDAHSYVTFEFGWNNTLCFPFLMRNYQQVLHSNKQSISISDKLYLFQFCFLPLRSFSNVFCMACQKPFPTFFKCVGLIWACLFV